ncbi:MAG: hypothetical protein WC100_14910 [Sterolibacterium sp.]
MIILPLPILALPLVLAVMAIDAYLILVSVFLLAEHIHPDGSLVRALKPITYRLPLLINRLLPMRWRRPTPHWLHWLIALIGLLVIRHGVIAIAILVAQPPA